MSLSLLLRMIMCLYFSMFMVGESLHASAINYTVTPIKYELDLDPGESVTLPASIRNNGSGGVTLGTTTSDFQASGSGGIPSIVRKSELVFPDQELSSWITLSAPSLTLAAGEEGSINFTINVPTNATPGGHYGAVLFKNPNSVSSPGKIGINVDYGIIILVNVSGEIEVEVEINEPSISSRGGSSGSPKWFTQKDNCKFGDFTPSRYDERCFGSDESLLFGDDDGDDTTSIANNNNSEPTLFDQDFGVTFNLPVTNNGNTHIKPDGKITLRDENGEVLKAVGREVIVNNRGLITGEKIVDYIPINDQQGNVLPQTQRTFESIWEGFPYQTYNEYGEPVIEYWTPGEYYTSKNKREAGFLMPWQRISQVLEQKNITADIEIEYQDENGNPIVFNTAKEFEIEYIEEQVTLNPYVILGLLVLTIAGGFIFFAIKWWFLVAKVAPCWNCNTRIKSHWSTCPHCHTLQDKKKHKKLSKKK